MKQAALTGTYHGNPNGNSSGKPPDEYLSILFRIWIYSRGPFFQDVLEILPIYTNIDVQLGKLGASAKFLFETGAFFYMAWKSLPPF